MVLLAGALCVAFPGYQATAAEAAATIGDVLRPPRPHLLAMVGDGDYFESMRVDEDFVTWLAAQPGPLLTDNSGLAAAAGKPIEFEFQIFQLLGVEGRWSEQPILAAIDRRQFALVADAPARRRAAQPALDTRGSWRPSSCLRSRPGSRGLLAVPTATLTDSRDADQWRGNMVTDRLRRDEITGLDAASTLHFRTRQVSAGASREGGRDTCEAAGGDDRAGSAGGCNGVPGVQLGVAAAYAAQVGAAAPAGDAGARDAARS